MGGSSAVQLRDDVKGGHKEQLGGARADFVANLGRRRIEISGALDALREAPDSARYRDDLRRRIHALASGARLLRFVVLGDELRRLEERLSAAAARGTVSDEDFDAVSDIVARMASLAWGQTGTKTTTFPGQERSPRSEETPSPPTRAALVIALVVGKLPLSEALSMPSYTSDDASQDATFEVEHTDDVSVAADLAKAVAPDVVVIDGDLPGSFELVEALSAEPLTEAIPVVVCGRFQKPEEAARFVALGVARTLPKPISPGEIRRACATVISSYVKREIVREPLGAVNVDQLGARLAEELRKGLSAVDQRFRETRVDLGEGTEVLAALWGAVARIRDVMTIKSRGGVRFLIGGPEGAMPLAPWLGGAEGREEPARSFPPRGSRAVPAASLDKTRVVVADDDPAVVWFLAGVLKAAGATVYEARDGEKAFDVAKRCEPDLVITDILMPKLDGFALSRSLKRDPVLRDVPVVLLSWKEDLLQRVRELGADADGYLRKEASAGAVVQRVRELLRHRLRITERIASPSEVRGRLDGLTTATLLKLVCTTRPNATVNVRDATHLYEIEVRGGRPVRATRTSTSGSLERGPSVLASLLGAGDGRFVVAPAREDEEVGAVRSELSGSLGEQLAPVVAGARAAQQLLVGANLVRIQRVVVDHERLEAYLAATPEPARKLLRAVADGASPRSIITSGQAAPRLLEDVLADAAAHGSVIEVFDLAGVDRLPEATRYELALLRADRSINPITSVPVLALPTLTPSPARAVEVSMPGALDVLKVALASAPAPNPLASFPAPSYFPLAGGAAMAEADPPVLSPAPGAAMSTAAVGMSDVAHEVESPVPPSGPRAVTPPPGDVRALLTGEARPNVRTPSPRPVSVRSDASIPELALRELTPTPSELPPPPGLKPMLTLGSLHPPPVVSEPQEVEAPKPKKTKTPKPNETSSKKEREREATPSAPFVDRHAPMLPSAFLPRLNEPRQKDRKALYWVLFALCGVSFALWARWSRNKGAVSEDALVPAVVATVEATADPTADATSAPVADDKKPKPASKDDDAAPEDLPLRDYDKVKKGQGMLEVVAGKSDTIYIDGKPMGSGPVQSVALKAKPEPYEVKVKLRGEERVRFVTLKDGRLTRVRVAPPWAR